MAKYLIEISPDKNGYMAHASHAGTYLTCVLSETPEAAKEELIEKLRKKVKEVEIRTSEIIEVEGC